MRFLTSSMSSFRITLVAWKDEVSCLSSTCLTKGVCHVYLWIINGKDWKIHILKEIKRLRTIWNGGHPAQIKDSDNNSILYPLICCCCLRCSERASYDSAQPHTLTYGPLPPLPTIYVMCMPFLTNISRIISETRCSCYGYIVVESFLNRVWARFQWKTGRVSTDIRYITPDLSYLR